MVRYTNRKVKDRFHLLVVKALGNYAYPAFWHLKFRGVAKNPDRARFYLAARPNPGAGIGHQMANWIAGLWWSRQFGLKFAHIPFSTDSWERFLGFGEGYESVAELKKQGWAVRRIPLFNENRPETLCMVRQIISSYGGG